MTSPLFPSQMVDAALLARPRAPNAHAAATPAQAAHTAAAFETFFLARTIESLQAGLSTDGPFGGGPGESVWRSFLSEAYAEAVVGQGGIGLSERLTAELIHLQNKE